MVGPVKPIISQFVYSDKMAEDRSPAITVILLMNYSGVYQIRLVYARSSMTSDIWSQNLSGCPSVNDSDVKNMFFGYVDMIPVSYLFSFLLVVAAIYCNSFQSDFKDLFQAF